jgi:putative ABC transport system permease protein
MVTGKSFSADNGASNENFIVLNESAVEAFHFKSAQEAMGQEIILKEDSARKMIIGIVKNYNHSMLMQKLEPMALMYKPLEYRMLQVKYTGTYEDAGKSIEKAWTAINPALKVDYKDFNKEVHKMYDIFFGDLVSLLSIIAFLAILISCLGLLGMATYATETRTKEISVRKILGSSNSSLVYLLSRGYAVILLLAIAIAVPAAYFINNLWLEEMAYHVTVDLATVLSGISALVILGILTIGSQMYRAAFINPVENLKTE